MFVSFVTSVFVTLVTTLTITATSLSRRGQNRIIRRRLRTSEDAAELLAGLPTEELRDLDVRLHAWIEQDEMADFLGDLSDEDAVRLVMRLKRIPRRGQR